MKTYEVSCNSRLFRRSALKLRHNRHQAYHQRLSSRETALLDALFLIPGVMSAGTLTQYSVILQINSTKTITSLKDEIERVMMSYTGDTLIKVRFNNMVIEPRATPWRGANVGPRRIIN